MSSLNLKMVPLYVLQLNWARYTQNGNAIESICDLHYNYANYVNYASYLIGKNVS